MIPLLYWFCLCSWVMQRTTDDRRYIPEEWDEQDRICPQLEPEVVAILNLNRRT